MPRRFVSLGDPVMDVIAHVDALPPSIQESGGCLPIDENGMEELLSGLLLPGGPGPRPRHSPGGSACNVARGVSELLSRLGGGSPATVEFIGMAGEDETAGEYERALSATGVTPRLLRAKATSAGGAGADGSSPPAPRTATCLCLVTSDGQRTMRTCLGAAAMLRRVDQLPEGWCSGGGGGRGDVSALHVEGYALWRDGLASGAMRAARGPGSRPGRSLPPITSIDCASFEVVRARREELEALLRSGDVDVLFCNEEEAAALAGAGEEGRGEREEEGRGGAASADEDVIGRALRRALELGASVAVASLGPAGARAMAVLRRRRGEEREREEETEKTSSRPASFACYSCPAEPVDAVEDTVGAGDAFAAGFLASLLLARDGDEGEGEERTPTATLRPTRERFFSGASIEAALRLGCAAGAAAVRVSGADPGAEAWDGVAATAAVAGEKEEKQKEVEVEGEKRRGLASV